MGGKKRLRFVFMAKGLAVITHRLHWSKAMLCFACYGHHSNPTIRLLAKHKTEASDIAVFLSVCNALLHILPSPGYESSLYCSPAGKADYMLVFLKIYCIFSHNQHMYWSVIVNNIWQIYPARKPRQTFLWLTTKRCKPSHSLADYFVHSLMFMATAESS